MQVKTAKFVISSKEVEKCPKPDKPEYAFIGRSNVGKSSLVNLLTNNAKLAKVSSRPGKTQLINHFLINNEWFLVDLPGYGWASVGQEKRMEFQAIIRNYFQKRTNLLNVFVLVDSRHEPQKSDLDFMAWLTKHNLPFSLVFTKCDKQSNVRTDKNIAAYKREMLKSWEEFPKYFKTSTLEKKGQKEIVDYVYQVNQLFVQS